MLQSKGDGKIIWHFYLLVYSENTSGSLGTLLSGKLQGLFSGLVSGRNSARKERDKVKIPQFFKLTFILTTAVSRFLGGVLPEFVSWAYSSLEFLYTCSLWISDNFLDHGGLTKAFSCSRTRACATLQIFFSRIFHTFLYTASQSGRNNVCVPLFIQ